MPKAVDLTGESFGRLSVVRLHYRLDSRGRRERVWECHCECGKAIMALSGNLIHGRTMSCGCLFVEITAKRNYRHGLRNTRTYTCWAQMRARCRNPNNRAYDRYGGRGITVCERWADSFQAFFDDMGAAPSDDHSIDRIDNNGNYEPTNCRWATSVEQGCNKRNNVLLTHEGKTLPVSEWARITGFPEHVIRDRVKRHWPDHRTLSVEPRILKR